MAKRQVRDVAFLEAHIAELQDQFGHREAELGVALDRIKVLETTHVAQNHELDNRRTQQIDMASRIGVLESDRDRLTTVVEVLARRLMSPAAEKDRSRAGWRAMTDTWGRPAIHDSVYGTPRPSDKGTDKS